MRFTIIVRASRATIPYLLERWLGLNGNTARWIGSVLSQGGEFAFILFAVGVMQSMIGEPLVHLIKLVVTLSMAAQSLALFIDKPSPVPQRQSHLNRIAVGGLKHLAGHKDLNGDPPNRGAAFASLRAHAQPVPVLVDLTDANEERGESGLRKIHLNDNRRTTALLARNW